ncbi:MAG: hypothetical protein ABSG82_05290 [Sedimentisphaerales bacterium]
MKNAIAIVMTLVLATVSGCQSSSQRGGSVSKDEGFRVAVPTFSTEVKQGETKNVTVSLERGQYFKQDVKLQIKAAKGISVDPAKVLVKASDKPDVQLMITVPKDAALGEYKVSVTGTPTTGEPTSVKFKVKVVSP